MVEKLAFQLRSEEWLTSTVVIKIRYSNFDGNKTMPDPIHFADHTLTRSVTELFDKLYQRRMRLRLIGIRFSDWFAERTKSICLKIQRKCYRSIRRWIE
jgi:DNA polymerase-4